MDRPTSFITTDHITVELTVRLGRTTMTVAQLSALGPDDILTLDQEITDGVELCVGDRVIARGVLTTDGADERLFVRITDAETAS